MSDPTDQSVEESLPVRIAFGRLMQENNSFSSVLTTETDFMSCHLVAGQPLLKLCETQTWEIDGYLKNMELSGFMQAVQKADVAIQVVPLLSAWSVPGGPIERYFFDALVHDFCERLKAAEPVDAIYLALHGAMAVDGIEDAEVYLIEAIREAIGNIPVAVSFDLHANYTRAKHSAIDLCCSYHTNPHYDMFRTGLKTGQLLIDYLKESITPVKAWRSLPLLLAGGNNLSMLQPMRPLFQRIKQMEQHPEVLAVNLFMCHPFIAHPEVGWAVQVTTDNNKPLAEQLADELAERCWELRKKQPTTPLNVTDMLKKVRQAKLARSLGSIAVCDTSDVVAAGGTGENTHLLKALLENATDLICLYPLRDPVAVKALWEKSAGEKVSLVVGGRLQPEFNPPLTVNGTLLQKQKTRSFGKVVALDLGCVKLVLTEGHAMPVKPHFYEDLGLSVKAADIVVTKSFFHFKLFYLAHSRKTLYVKTCGVTDFERILELDLPYPAYPKDDIVDWRAIDARKRKARVPAHQNVEEPTLPYGSYRRLAPQKNRPTKKHWFWALLSLATLAHVAYHQENSLTFWKPKKRKTAP
jgi:microcystin degradation protein MlrC